ncbi:hypothetical protein B0I35DRAFT_408902 [Stachybotrys elegans]|uniref:Uncharacterized protein n=1 Tax=Stachybotrys elegans TaxID=80388 RepID=A0A8K0WRQ5_9HYPO|nr:hypothetical protein B0I35DRAFT_408902 [Stachybotrys elegans]
MYGSYGSYSSMSAMSAPMDITSSNLRAHDAACAFPSWPRRDSLSDSDRGSGRATSFLSDDDLFLSDPFEDDVRSISSSTSSSAVASPAVYSPPRMSDAELLAEMERERLQREYVRNIITEKERRRQQQAAAKRQHQQQQQRRSSPKRSPKTKLSAIVE